MYSSQNEQDNRNYAKAAKIAMFEPSDIQECIDMMKAAYDLSEEYDTPFMILRMTTRVCHSKSIVETGMTGRRSRQRTGRRIRRKYVCLPAISRNAPEPRVSGWKGWQNTARRLPLTGLSMRDRCGESRRDRFRCLLLLCKRRCSERRLPTSSSASPTRCR